MHYPGRIIVNRLPNKVEVTIPGRKNWITPIILGFIIVFWGVAGGITALGALPDKKEVDYSDWIWGVWGVAIVLITLYNILLIARAQETIVFNQSLITVKRQGGVFLHRNQYELKKAGYFRVEEDDDAERVGTRNHTVVGSGNISFYVDRKTVRFGEGVSREEGEALLQQLRKTGILNEKNFDFG